MDYLLIENTDNQEIVKQLMLDISKGIKIERKEENDKIIYIIKKGD